MTAFSKALGLLLLSSYIIRAMEPLPTDTIDSEVLTICHVPIAAAEQLIIDKLALLESEQTIADVRTEMNRLIPINLARHGAQDIRQYLEKHSLDEFKNLLKKTYEEACELTKMDRWVLEMPS